MLESWEDRTKGAFLASGKSLIDGRNPHPPDPDFHNGLDGLGASSDRLRWDVFPDSGCVLSYVNERKG